MKIADNWKDFEIIDCSDGEKLERWGNVLLIRPDPQIIWHTPKTDYLWKKADARYIRSSTGGGHWEFYNKIPEKWTISYGRLKFNVKNMGFKHTGLFPEQAVNWELCEKIIKNTLENENRQPKVLNLFAYTGAATVSALKAGAAVTHVDASKGMTSWAKENALSSGVSGGQVRWLVDDCLKFVEREIRRNNKYDIIIMDPPSYGRGPGGEVWKLEDKIYELVFECSKLLTENSKALLLNSYTTGLSPSVMEYILSFVLEKKFGGNTRSYELGLPVKDSGLFLPCGSTAVWTKSFIT